MIGTNPLVYAQWCSVECGNEAIAKFTDELLAIAAMPALARSMKRPVYLALNSASPHFIASDLPRGCTFKGHGIICTP